MSSADSKAGRGGAPAGRQPGVVGGRFGVAHAVTESLDDLPRRRPHHRPRSVDHGAFSRAHRNMRRLRIILIAHDGKKIDLVEWARRSEEHTSELQSQSNLV